MNKQIATAEGILYIVATPIGHRDDISRRAIDILTHVDLILAEDTRHSGQLLKMLSISKPMLSYHQHNEAARCQKILTHLQQGQSLALITDAGTPLISDPGRRLVHAAHANNIRVVPIPGACAAITALSAAGLESAHFYFVGFLAQKSAARCQQLAKLVQIPATLIIYESPHRLLAALADMVAVLGGHRLAVLAKELTKIHETIYQSNLNQLIAWLEEDVKRQRGEFVILVAAEPKAVNKEIVQQQQVLEILLAELPVKQAVNLTAKICGANKNKLYSLALNLEKKQ